MQRRVPERVLGERNFMGATYGRERDPGELERVVAGLA